MSNNSKKRGTKKEPVPIKYLLLFMTLLCSGAIYFSMNLNISGGPLHSAVGYVFVPMQKGINISGEFLNNCIRNIRTLHSVEAENEQLKQEIQNLQEEISALKLESYEVEEYRELLDLKSKYSNYETCSASVIAQDSSWSSTFTIDRGSSDGVEVGMNVIAGTGLVGIVTSVGSNYATVRTIIDDTASVSGMVLTTDDNIIVSGDYETMEENREILFSHLSDESNKVEIGDPVVTSYISDEYHQGILIGYISSVNTDSNNITKSGTITPAVNFEHLNNVLVILETKSTGVPETEEVE